MSATMTQQTEAINRLRELVQPGDHVYCILRHVSQSGMSRTIDLFLMRDNRPYWIGRTAADALDYRYDTKKDGIKIGGCGMDMGFAIVYALSRALFDGDGYKLESHWL